MFNHRPIKSNANFQVETLYSTNVYFLQFLGMKHYLMTHSYQNTQTEDLWASLETASGKPVGKVMTTWTSQMGFPLIRVDSK